MDPLIAGMPANWRTVPLGEVCEVTAGPGGQRAEKKTAEGVPVLAPRNIVENRLIGQPAWYVPPEVAKALGRYRTASGDLLCVRTGTLGRHALVPPEYDGALFSTGFLRLRPEPSLRSEFLRYYLDHPAVARWLSAHVVRTTVPSLSAQTVQTLPISLPPLDSQDEIVGTLRALEDKIAVHEEIIRSTRELKNLVLPELFRGDEP